MKRKKWNRLLYILIMVCVVLTGCSRMADGPKEGSCSITISIRCDTAVENGMNTQDKWKGIIPDNGCMLSDTVVKLKDDSTVFDALCAVRDDYGIQMEYSGGGKSAYIEGIGNLYERDGGRWSGWMYSVNGKYPGVGCGEYTLKDGDKVQWNYTCDLGEDLKAGSEESEKWKKEHE